MHGHTSKGFTLIELMVVIAVVAILAIVAMPSYRELMDNYRVRKAGEDVVSLISTARSGAVKLHREVNVSFTDGASWCVGANAAATPAAGALAGTAGACDCATTAGTTACMLDAELVTIAPEKHPGVSMASATNALVFNGVTGATNGLVGSTVILDSPLDKFSATVTVTPLGQANLTVGPKKAN